MLPIWHKICDLFPWTFSLNKICKTELTESREIYKKRILCVTNVLTNCSFMYRITFSYAGGLYITIHLKIPFRLRNVFLSISPFYLLIADLKGCIYFFNCHYDVNSFENYYEERSTEFYYLTKSLKFNWETQISNFAPSH